MISMSCTKTNVNQFWHDVESVSAIASMMIEVIPRHNGTCFQVLFLRQIDQADSQTQVGTYTL